jgi:hypothetical protein
MQMSVCCYHEPKNKQHTISSQDIGHLDTCLSGIQDNDRTHRILFTTARLVLATLDDSEINVFVLEQGLWTGCDYLENEEDTYRY